MSSSIKNEERKTKYNFDRILTVTVRGVQQSFEKTGGIKSNIDLLIQIPTFIRPDEIYM